jgi:hypothetical protein
MAKIWLDWSDGCYSTRLLTDDEAAEHEAKGFDVAYIEDSVYEAYLRHCGRDAGWQALWRAISNEQHMRRRERELLPLEEASREIERLRDELARAQRTAKFFEDVWRHKRASDVLVETEDENVRRSVHEESEEV